MVWEVATARNHHSWGVVDHLERLVDCVAHLHQDQAGLFRDKGSILGTLSSFQQVIDLSAHMFEVSLRSNVEDLSANKVDSRAIEMRNAEDRLVCFCPHTDANPLRLHSTRHIGLDFPERELASRRTFLDQRLHPRSE